MKLKIVIETNNTMKENIMGDTVEGLAQDTEEKCFILHLVE